jgi:cytochrome P450
VGTKTLQQLDRRRADDSRRAIEEDDAKQFEYPDTLDIERWPDRHTAFGIGVHRCAGSHLGRTMVRELIGQVITRMSLAGNSGPC